VVGFPDATGHLNVGRLIQSLISGQAGLPDKPVFQLYLRLSGNSLSLAT